MRLFVATFVALSAIVGAQISQLCGNCEYCRGSDGECYDLDWDTYECPEGSSYCPYYMPCRSPDGQCFDYDWDNDDWETGIGLQCPEGTTPCAACINSISTELDPNAIDDGCSPSAPVCVTDSGDSLDLGALGTTCVAKCFDTSRSRIDEGVSCCAVFGSERSYSLSHH